MIVDTTENEDTVVLYVCICLDGWDREEGKVEECTEGGGAVDVGGGLSGAALCAVVDGWLQGNLRCVGGEGSHV